MRMPSGGNCAGHDGARPCPAAASFSPELSSAARKCCDHGVTLKSPATITGSVRLKIPETTQNGQVFRLKVFGRFREVLDVGKKDRELLAAGRELDLLEEAQTRKLLSLEHDQKSGGYVIKKVTE